MRPALIWEPVTAVEKIKAVAGKSDQQKGRFNTPH